MGARIFRFSLLVLAAAFFEHAVILIYLYNRGDAPAWAVYLHHETYYRFRAALRAGVRRHGDVEREPDRPHHAIWAANWITCAARRKQTLDLDRLTGLFNQAALARRVEEPDGFEGVVAVCDMDNFKDVNDRYGHLVGDEILRNIGNLLQSSIRHEDEAFRWGGDEFVILFHNQRDGDRARAHGRYRIAPARFPRPRLRRAADHLQLGHRGAHGRPLREALDEADRNMYVLKRSRAAVSSQRERPPAP